MSLIYKSNNDIDYRAGRCEFKLTSPCTEGTSILLLRKVVYDLFETMPQFSGSKMTISFLSNILFCYMHCCLMFQLKEVFSKCLPSNEKNSQRHLPIFYSYLNPILVHRPYSNLTVIVNLHNKIERLANVYNVYVSMECQASCIGSNFNL